MVTTSDESCGPRVVWSSAVLFPFLILRRLTGHSELAIDKSA